MVCVGRDLNGNDDDDDSNNNNNNDNKNNQCIEEPISFTSGIGLV